MYLVLGVFLGIIGGTGAGMFIAKGVAARKVAEARSQAEDIVKEARSSAERDSKLLVSEARDEASKVRLEAERDAKERRVELQRTERLLEQKEEKLDRKLEKLQHREDEMKTRQDDLEKKIQEADELCKRRVTDLEQIAQMTSDQARAQLLHEVEDSAQHAIGLRLAEMEAQMGDGLVITDLSGLHAGANTISGARSSSPPCSAAPWKNPRTSPSAPCPCRTTR